MTRSRDASTLDAWEHATWPLLALNVGCVSHFCCMWNVHADEGLKCTARTSPGVHLAQSSALSSHWCCACRVLAILLQISATLYSQGLDPPQVSVVLASLAIANWVAFDRTAQGAVLAVVCALTAPTSELILNHFFGLWHYPEGDLFGIVSWCEAAVWHCFLVRCHCLALFLGARPGHGFV